MKIISDFLVAFFESLGLYAADYSEHLKGLDVACEGYNSQSIYNIIFIYLFIIDGLFIINYYYGLFNRVPWNTWQRWLMLILFPSLIVSIIAFVYGNNDLRSGNFCAELRFTMSDCIGFAIATFIFSCAWCFMLSLLVKWQSSVNRRVPF